MRNMIGKLTVRGFLTGLLLAGLAGLTGCATTDGGSGFPNSPSAGGRTGDVPSSDRFNVGELVVVTFSGLDTPIPPHEEKVKEDGTITLVHIGSVTALGKTPGELQREIRSAYIERGFFRENLMVTVRAAERFYFVGGQVRNPNRYPYTEGMTVLKAVQSAGDFNEFAKQTRVQVTRLDGRTIIVDCKKARRNPKYDVPIYPGDRIDVPRSL